MARLHVAWRATREVAEHRCAHGESGGARGGLDARLRQIEAALDEAAAALGGAPAAAAGVAGPPAAAAEDDDGGAGDPFSGVDLGGVLDGLPHLAPGRSLLGLET